MLDSFIIEELKRREEQERNRSRERPVLELPIDDRGSPRPARRDDDDAEKEPQRGVIVIDI